MENSESTVPSQTDIPVSSASPKFNISSIKVYKLVGGLGAILVIIIIGFFVLSLNRQPSSKTAEISTKVRSQISQGKYEDAQTTLRGALASDTKNTTLNSQMVSAIALQGNQTGTETKTLAAAQPYIDTLNSQKVKDATSLIALGYAYETTGDYQKAFDYYDKAAKAAPESSDAWFHRGHSLMFLNKSGEGYDDYKKAVQFDSNNALAQMGLAAQLYSENKTEEAFQAYKRVAKIPGISNQNEAEALATAADIRRTQDNFKYMQESFDLSKAAIDADPTFAPALAAYGYNLFLTGNPTLGEDYMKKAIAANPRISKTYSDLGILLRGVKNFTDSVNDQKQAIELVKNDNTIMSANDKAVREASYDYQLAKTYSMSGANVDIIPLLQQAIQLNPYIKTVIKSDQQELGLFKEMSGNPAFQELIK